MNISRKIFAPPLPSIILHRERLAQALQETPGAHEHAQSPFSYRLALLCAPAGSGKTTLLVDTIQRLSLPCCWYFLDHADRESTLFLETLITSIRQRFPGFGPGLNALLAEMLAEDELSLQALLDALIEALATELPERCVLALCNYQEVNGNLKINSIVDQLLKRLPPHCLLIIESSTFPELELTPLRAERKMVELGERDLLFSARDIYELAQVQGLSAFTQEHKTRSYENLSHALVKGTLLLARQQYIEAESLFKDIVHLSSKAEIQVLHMQALLRLAACHAAQAQSADAQTVLRQAIALNSNANQTCTLQVEMQTYPALRSLMQEAIEQSEPLPVVTFLRDRLSISALGETIVSINEVPVRHWRTARAQELFFFLVENDQALHKDRIIASLWPDADNLERMNQTFRLAVYYIRQAIGEACLTQQSSLYRLDLSPMYGQIWYDVTAFTEQQRIAEAALKEEDDESAAQAFRKMITLYRGDYLQACYSDWCSGRREKLRQALIEARRNLALIAWRREAYDESLRQWQHLLTLDPCLETAHYGAMRCYLRQGKRSLALRQYQRCTRELHEQLNVRPGLALQKLYQYLANAYA